MKMQNVISDFVTIHSCYQLYDLFSKFEIAFKPPVLNRGNGAKHVNKTTTKKSHSLRRRALRGHIKRLPTLRGDLAPRQLSVGLMASRRATGQRTCPGGAAESSAGASLTHVGQRSVEIGLMNRVEGGGVAAGRLVFQFSPPSLSVGPALMCTPAGGEAETGRSVGGTSVKTYEKDVRQ